MDRSIYVLSSIYLGVASDIHYGLHGHYYLTIVATPWNYLISVLGRSNRQKRSLRETEVATSITTAIIES